MKKLNVSCPSGFPEWTPSQKRIEENWIHIIREVFESYGFFPIETPLVEREENLLAKGGNAKEMYALKRILDDPNDASSHSGNALRFDLTVPLALYVARHLNEIAFPFRRYAIGSVMRGERAQHGRFRQFTQCDIDVIGFEELSLANDALMPAIIIGIFEKLNIGDFVVRINNRKILKGLHAFIGGTQGKESEMLQAVDNLDKGNVNDSPSEAAAILLELQNCKTMKDLKKHKASQNMLFAEGVHEVEEIFICLESMGVNKNRIQLDPKIARGLDYYTGTVFETNLINADGSLNTALGSICSGGRFDDLAGIFTGKKLPGVGISIGLTRLLSKLFEANILHTDESAPSDVLVIALNKNCIQEALGIGNSVRSLGYRTENYLEEKKVGKQFEYANKLNIPYCMVIGEDEIKKNMVQIKNMKTGIQEEVATKNLKKKFQEWMEK